MDLLVDSFIKDLKDAGDCSAMTLLAYKNDANQFVRFLRKLNDRPAQISDFDNTHVNQYFDNQRQLGRKHNTLLRRRSTLRRMAMYLNDQQLSDVSPYVGSALTEDKTEIHIGENKNPTPLTIFDVEQVIEVIGLVKSPRALRDFVILSMLAIYGISISTLISVNVEDFDYLNNIIVTNSQESSISYQHDVKYISGQIRKYLSDGRPNLTDSRIENGFFVSQMGGRISRQAVWQSLQNWGKDAKILPVFTPRTIQYAAVRDMIEKSVQIKEIQHRIGHKNIFSTQALIRRITK